jgi:5-amino-6-(5-phosphoribosylamino)uracil reductase/diaminohydroxyphosphoribosylaminopyrimidine deaminase/5-amino-6-(5-phosphoribosylamino)uracil reductase
MEAELLGGELAAPALSVAALQEIARPAIREPWPLERPYVTLAFAQTLDGRIATRNGDSQWISGQESLTFAHCLRAAHDAILVGIGTVLRDDPRLTTRLVPGTSPTRVVIDSLLRMPAEAAMLSDESAGETIVFTTERAAEQHGRRLRAAGVQVIMTAADAEGHVDLAAALRHLAGTGIRSVLIEGGARIITAALKAQLVDRMAVCVAPKLLGTGVNSIGDLGIARLADAMWLERHRLLRLGNDLVVIGEVVR